MKYTIGTDDLFAAMHLITLNECFDHSLSYATMPVLGTVTTLVDLVGEEFVRIANENGMLDGKPIFESKDSPMYGALLDLQQMLRKTEGQLSRLIDSRVMVR